MRFLLIYFVLIALFVPLTVFVYLFSDVVEFYDAFRANFDALFFIYNISRSC